MSRRRQDVQALGDAARNDVIDVDAPLVVACWNVHKGVDDGLARELHTLLTDRACDLALLQEFRPRIPVPAGYSGHHARSFRRGPLGPHEGVTTLASVAAIEARRVRSPQRELWVLTPKAALVSRFPLSDGHTLTCVNVHGLNFDPSGRQLARQLDDLHRFVDPLDGPLVVGGDFNTWNERRMNAVRTLTRGLGLAEVLPDVPGGKTGALRAPKLERLLSLDRRLHLDRLFVRGLRPLHASWLDTFECSDHVPLCAQLSWE